MRKRTLLLTVALIVGFSAQAFASHVGNAIASLQPLYGASWDWQGGLRYELWRVLDDAGFSALANDVCLDITGQDLLGNSGTPSSSYHAYQDSFWQTNDGSYTNKLIAEVAGYAPNNRFGWYEKGGAGWGELFSGSDASGATASFTYSNTVGFWLNPNGVSGLYYYTDTAANSGNDLQAVTFYLGDYAGYGNEYLICFEDLDYSGCCDRDFQDMIVRLKDPTVPEPASLSLLGLGLLGFLGKRRKAI